MSVRWLISLSQKIDEGSCFPQKKIKIWIKQLKFDCSILKTALEWRRWQDSCGTQKPSMAVWRRDWGILPLPHRLPYQDWHGARNNSLSRAKGKQKAPPALTVPQTPTILTIGGSHGLHKPLAQFGDAWNSDSCITPKLEHMLYTP